VVMMQHLKEPPPDPRLMNPHLSPALSLVILRCLAKNPSERFSSASSLTAALAESFNLPVPEELDPPAYPRDVLNTPTYHQPATPYTTLVMQPSAPLPALMEASSPTPVLTSG